jgi:hypothetical protein
MGTDHGLRLLLATALLAAQPWSTRAQEPGYNYSIVGAGNVSCGSWLSGQERLFLASWIQGYITASSLYKALLDENKDGEYDIDSGAGVEQWITNYCTTNPLKKLADAAFDLILVIPEK